MKAAVYDHPGPPSVLRLAQLPDPSPGPGQVLVAVEAISLEGGDLLNRRHRPATDGPRVVGYAAAGTVAALGEASSGVAVGDRVAAFGWGGSHAELMVVAAEHVVALPDGMDARVAATVPVAFGTAQDALLTYGGLQPGETVLIRGATGGVGLAAVQLARAAGATVIATASGQARVRTVTTLGADHVVDGRDPDLTDRLRELTDGAGVDLVVDLVGRGLEQLTPAIVAGGRISVTGAAAGQAHLPLDRVMFGRLRVTGVLLGLEMGTPRVRRMLARLMGLVAAGRAEMPIDRVFPLAEAAAAHAHAEDGHPDGRVILVP